MKRTAVVVDGGFFFERVRFFRWKYWETTVHSLWITLLMKFRNVLKTLCAPVTQAPDFV